MGEEGFVDGGVGPWRRLQVFVACAVVLAAVGLGRQLWATDFGFGETHRGSDRIVTEVDHDGAADRAGIVVGDVVVADPGLDTWVEPWTERELWRWNRRLGKALRTGHVPMRIRRGGAELDVDVQPLGPTISATVRQLRHAGPLMPTVFAFLAMAAVLARRPRRAHRAHRIIAYSFACLGPCWAFNFPAPCWPPWFLLLGSIVVNVMSVAGIALLASFVWSFPSRSRLADARGLKPAVVVVSAAAAITSVLDNNGVIAGPLPGNNAQVIANLTLTAGILVGLVWQVRNAAGIIARRQATALLAAVVVGFGLAIVGVVIPRLLGANNLLAFVIFFPAPGLLPLGFALAVLRYRLFDADGLAPKAAVYAVVVVTSGAAYVAVMAGIEAAFAAQWNDRTAVGRWVGFIVVLALGEPLRAVGQRVLDQWLARDRRAFLARCSTLAADVASASDASAVEALVRDTLDARKALVLDLRETIAREMISEAAQRALAEKGTERVVEIRDTAVVDALLAVDVDVLVAVPGHVPRVLAVSLRAAPKLLDGSAREALRSVGRVIGAALDRNEERAGFTSKLRDAADERAQIAMELHDGTGATLAAARLLTQLARTTHEGSGDTAGTLEALERTLEDGLVDMRSTLWTLDQSHGTWGALAAQVRRHAGDVCTAARLELAMSADDGNGHTPTARVRLAVFRVVQEALNNVVRHAAAKRVICKLSASDVAFELVIEDDGIGLLATGRETARADGRGLRNMQSRVESLGGTLSFMRPEGGGTRIVAEIPLPASPTARA